jgi:type IV secretory pathway TrbD component
MSLFSVLIAIVVVGVLLWLINTYLPMDGKIKGILNVVVVIVLVLWLLSAFGVLGSQSSMHIGKFHMRW